MVKKYFITTIVMGILLSGCSGGGGSGGGVGGAADFVGPTLPSNLVLSAISPSRIQTPSLSGITEANSTIEIYSGSNCTGALVGSGVSDGSGNFNLTTSSLNEGTYDLSVKVTNAQGVSSCSSQSASYVVDLTGPSVTLSNPTLGLMGAGNWLKYTVTYSEPSQITLAPSDVNLQTTGTANCTVSVNNVSTTVAEIVVSTCTGNAGVGNINSTYTFDNIGPLAALSVATNVYDPIPATVDVTYSVDTDMSTVTTADFLVLGTCGVTLASVSSVGNVATLHLNGIAGCGLASTTIITSLLTSVSDTAGNPGIGVVLVTLTKGL